MIRMRGPVVLVAAIALGVAGCGGGGKPVSGGAGTGGPGGTGGAGGTGAAGAGGGGGTASDASADADARPDLATDFGTPEVDGHCPSAPGALAPAAAELVIDDFEGSGRLDGRQRGTTAFTVKEQFDATAAATFAPAPAIETGCGAAGPGAAHIRGRAAGPGANLTLVFSVPGGGAKPVDHYDASATKGLSFRVALGDASASKLVTVQVNVTQSPWDYTKDLSVSGTAWQTVTVLWSDLQAAPNADPFSAATLNQIVFPFFADTDVDFYIDDIAFVK